MRNISMPLVSNGYTLSDRPQRLGWLEPTNPNLPMAHLREKYQQHGYLWLKGILKRTEVLAFRQFYFEAFRESGLLTEGSEAVEGIYSGNEDKIAAHKVMVESVRWAEYEAFCTAAPIVNFYERFLDGAVYLHRRKLIRYNKPLDPHCTGGHYDLVYLRGGTNQLCTSWIPIGDTPVEMGGLTYLEGSHIVAQELESCYAKETAHLPYEERISAYSRKAKSGWLTEDLNKLAEQGQGCWLVADYEVGDMVVHSPYLMHGSTVNHDKAGRMRLSTDIRYQLNSEAIDPRWVNHWQPNDGL